MTRTSSTALRLVALLAALGLAGEQAAAQTGARLVGMGVSVSSINEIEFTNDFVAEDCREEMNIHMWTIVENDWRNDIAEIRYHDTTEKPGGVPM